MVDIDNIDIKKELKELRQKVRQLDTVFDYNTITHSELVPFLLKIIRKFDRRLDAVEARLDAIDTAFQESLARFPA